MSHASLLSLHTDQSVNKSVKYFVTLGISIPLLSTHGYRQVSGSYCGYMCVYMMHSILLKKMVHSIKCVNFKV